MSSGVSFQEQPLLWICGIPLVLLYSLSFVFSDSIQLFSLVTANTLITHTYVWNLVTCSFFEVNFVKLLVDCGLLWLLSSSIGSPSNVEQFILFFAFSLLACSLGASAFCFFRFVGSGSEYPLLAASYGFGGLAISLAMFARYLRRGEPLHPRFPALVTFHSLPVYLFAATLLAWIVGLRSCAADILFSFVGLVFSWSYLKFFYKHTENEPAGDRSDDFSFVGMFPEAMHIVLVPFTTAFYNLLALINVFPPLEQQERRFAQHHLRNTLTFTAPSGSHTPPSSHQDDTTPKAKASKADVVAERRKARAMKVLDAKMAELAKEVDAGWDDVATDALEAGRAGGDSQTEPSRTFKI